MPQSVKNWSLMFIVLTLAMVLATPVSSQVMVASSIFTTSSGFQEAQTQKEQKKHFKSVERRKKKKLRRMLNPNKPIGMTGINSEPYTDAAFALWMTLKLKQLECSCHFYNTILGEKE